MRRTARSNRRLWTAAATAALVALVAAASAASRRDNLPAAGSAGPRMLGLLDVAVAEPTMLEAGITIAGPLEPHRVVEVRAQLAGTIEGVFVERGQPVRQGEPLAVYDAAAVRSQLAGAEAAVAAAESAVLAAVREEEAAEALFAAGAIAERALRQARSAAAAAHAELRAAEARRVEARDAVRRARVVAPGKGVVTRRLVSAGEAVSPGQPLFTVVDVDTLELAARVPAHALADIAVGRRIIFTTDALPGRRFEGHVARIDAVADPATRQVTVYARLPNEHRELVGGLYATGRILSEAHEAVLTVPAEALRDDGGAAYVLVITDGRITRRDVVPGASDPTSGRRAVASGVSAGEVVLVGPAGDLREGSAVQLPHELVAPAVERRP
jgi:membrane fusion protein, multidrug efflux system